VEILKYKEFEGSAELDMKRNVCRGKILFIDDVVTYESASIQDLQNEFEEAVDDYIETCKQIGKEPQKSCRGQFNVRVSPELHRAATRRSIADDTSLNEVVRSALQAYLASTATPSKRYGYKPPAAGDLQILTLSTALVARMNTVASTSTTVRLIDNERTAEITEPKDYFDTIGSSSSTQTLPTMKEKSYAH
jgi:predicted HicB family RNase H-like nuclease